MTLRRSRRRAPAQLPTGMTLGSLLPLALMVGGCALDEDELVGAEPSRVPAAA